MSENEAGHVPMMPYHRRTSIHDAEAARSAGAPQAALAPETLAVLRQRIREGAYDEPTFARRLAGILVRRGLG